MTNTEDITDALDRLVRVVDGWTLHPRHKYHYFTVPASDVIGCARLCVEPDSYISDDPTSQALRELLRKGYRWIRTDGEYAVFEKIV
jgi:hypothetical protein